MSNLKASERKKSGYYSEQRQVRENGNRGNEREEAGNRRERKKEIGNRRGRMKGRRWEEEEVE